MRLFYLKGIYGRLGVLAEGCEFEDGTVCLRWKEPFESTEIHPSIDMVRTHHCRGKNIELHTLDGFKPPPDVVPNNTKCSVCGQPQSKTPSGLVCANGHGGAPPLEDDENPLKNIDDVLGDILNDQGS